MTYLPFFHPSLLEQATKSLTLYWPEVLFFFSKCVFQLLPVCHMFTFTFTFTFRGLPKWYQVSVRSFCRQCLIVLGSPSVTRKRKVKVKVSGTTLLWREHLWANAYPQLNPQGRTLVDLREQYAALKVTQIGSTRLSQHWGPKETKPLLSHLRKPVPMS